MKPIETPRKMVLRTLLLLLLAAALVCACSPPPPGSTAPPPSPGLPSDPIARLLGEYEEKPLARMGYTTQVGAFASLDNAVRLERRLGALGIDAYYFRHESGLYKVRFGNHGSYQGARAEAERLQAQGLIDAFFIVAPGDYAAARVPSSGRGDLRAELVETARRFIGTPYRWGGTDREEGFDCSGLTMVCYRLNGLDLPRNSRSQFDAGRTVARHQLRPGDLVFFATGGGRRVSHVGLYIGEERFIHAPRTGKTVRIEKMTNPFFARTYMGGRSYL